MVIPLTCVACGSTLYSTVQPKVNKEMTKRRKTQRRIKFSICLNPNETSQGANVSFIPLEVNAENS